MWHEWVQMNDSQSLSQLNSTWWRCITVHAITGILDIPLPASGVSELTKTRLKKSDDFAYSQNVNRSGSWEIHFTMDWEWNSMDTSITVGRLLRGVQISKELTDLREGNYRGLYTRQNGLTSILPKGFLRTL